MGVVRYTFYSQALGEQTNIMAIVPTYEPWRHTEGCKKFYGNYEKKKTLSIRKASCFSENVKRRELR